MRLVLVVSVPAGWAEEDLLDLLQSNGMPGYSVGEWKQAGPFPTPAPSSEGKPVVEPAPILPTVARKARKAARSVRLG